MVGFRPYINFTENPNFRGQNFTRVFCKVVSLLYVYYWPKNIHSAFGFSGYQKFGFNRIPGHPGTFSKNQCHIRIQRQKLHRIQCRLLFWQNIYGFLPLVALPSKSVCFYVAGVRAQCPQDTIWLKSITWPRMKNYTWIFRRSISEAYEHMHANFQLSRREGKKVPKISKFHHNFVKI